MHSFVLLFGRPEEAWRSQPAQSPRCRTGSWRVCHRCSPGRAASPPCRAHCRRSWSRSSARSASRSPSICTALDSSYKSVENIQGKRAYVRTCSNANSPEVVFAGKFSGMVRTVVLSKHSMALAVIATALFCAAFKRGKRNIS